MKATFQDLRIDDRGYLTSLKSMTPHEWNILLGELFTAYTELKQANEAITEAIAEELFPGTLDALESLKITMSSKDADRTFVFWKDKNVK